MGTLDSCTTRASWCSNFWGYCNTAGGDGNGGNNVYGDNDAKGLCKNNSAGRASEHGPGPAAIGPRPPGFANNGYAGAGRTMAPKLGTYSCTNPW